MRKSRADGEVWPAIAESFYRLFSGHVERVEIGIVDLGQCFNQIRRVAFIPTKSSPN